MSEISFLFKNCFFVIPEISCLNELQWVNPFFEKWDQFFEFNGFLLMSEFFLNESSKQSKSLSWNSETV